MRSKAKSDVFDHNCGSRRILDLVGSKWKALIMCALGSGSRRYNDLVRRIEGISQKMLTQTLRSLESDGLVERKAYGMGEQKVEYSLTRLGKAVNRPLTQLCRWADEHLDVLDAVGSHNSDDRRPNSGKRSQSLARVVTTAAEPHISIGNGSGSTTVLKEVTTMGSEAPVKDSHDMERGDV